MNQFRFLILKSILQRTLLNQEHSDLWQYLIQGSGDHWHVTGEFHYLVGQSGERLQGKILWRVNLSDIGINSSCAGGSLVLMLVQPFSYSLTVASSLNHSLACWLAQTAGWPWPLHYLTQCVIFVCMCVSIHILVHPNTAMLHTLWPQGSTLLRYWWTCFMSMCIMCVLSSSPKVHQIYKFRQWVSLFS